MGRGTSSLFNAETRRMARGRFPQGPTRSRPVGKLHTFGRVCLRGGQKYFSLPSLAAQLRAFLVLLPCTHKWLQRKRSLQAWYRLRLWGLLVRFFPFCQQLLFAAAHKPERPRAGRLFLSVTNSPCCRALRACLLDISVCRQNVRAETSIAALAVVV